MAHGTHPFVFALLAGREDKNPIRPDEVTWADIVAMLNDHEPATSEVTSEQYAQSDSVARRIAKDGAAWMPAKLSESGGREREDVLELFALVLDFDKGTTREEIDATLHGREYVAHSTFSHTAEKPRYRVVLPLQAPIPPEHLRRLFDVFNAKFDGKADATVGHSPAQIHYLPRHPKDAEASFEVWHCEGALLDYQVEIALAGVNELVADAVTTATLARARSDCGEALRFDVGYPDGERTAALTKRAGYCFGRGMTLAATTAKCIEWNALNDPPLPNAKVAETCESVAKTHIRKTEAADTAATKAIAALNEQYVWVKKYSRAFRTGFNDFVSPGDLRNTYGNRLVQVLEEGHIVRRSLGEAWLKSPQRRECDDVDYLPGKDRIVGSMINTWPGWGCKAVAGDVSLWHEVLNLLLPDPAVRRWFEQWCAYPFQHPGAKLNTAVVLWSPRQGVGKSLIGQTLGLLYGARNFRTITAAELHGSFNSWAKDCQFVLGEENASTDQRADANKLKHLITGETVTINEKHQPTREQRNSMNFLFTSNHPDAFHLEMHDRRFFVWEVTAEKQPAVFYRRFVTWRDGSGKQALLDHLQHVDLAGFDPHGEAPLTAAKEHMIEMSRTELERFLSELRDPDTARAVLGKVVVSVEELAQAYLKRFGVRTSTTTVGKALTKLGIRTEERKRVTVGKGLRVHVHAIADRDYWLKQDAAHWVPEFLKRMPLGSV